MKNLLLLIPFCLFFVFSDCKQQSFDEITDSQHWTTPYSAASRGDEGPVNFDVATFHNDLMGVGINGSTLTQYKSFLNGLTEGQKDALFFDHVDLTKDELELLTGLTVDEEILAEIMYNSLIAAKTLSNFTMTSSYLEDLGVSEEAAEILLDVNAIIETYANDPSEAEEKIDGLRVAIPNVNSEEERAFLGKALDLAIATNAFWNSTNPGITTPQGKVTLTAAQQADLVGFCEGAWNGAKYGAIAGGGPAGAIALGLLGGAAGALGASMWAHFIPNAWWNPFA